jgi:hypothetical protein
VDRLTESIKRYVRQVDTRAPDKPEGRRAMEIVSFASNLEHFGEIIDKNSLRAGGQEEGPCRPAIWSSLRWPTSYSACIPHDA